MRICTSIVFIFFGLAGILSSTRGSRNCKYPKGNAGDTTVSGCLERVCTRFRREHVWLDSFATSVCCSYQGVGFPKGSTITFEKAEDGCSNVTLTCEDAKGMPAIKMKVESDCDAVTFVEALEEKATCCPCEITNTSATTSPTITSTTASTATPVNTTPSTSEPAGGQTADMGITPWDVLDFTVEDNKNSLIGCQGFRFACRYANFNCIIACSGKPCNNKCTYRCEGKVCNPITCGQANPYHCVPATTTRTPTTTTTTATTTTTITKTTMASRTNGTGTRIICDDELKDYHAKLTNSEYTYPVQCCNEGTTTDEKSCGNGTKCEEVCGKVTCAKLVSNLYGQDHCKNRERDGEDKFEMVIRTISLTDCPQMCVTGAIKRNCGPRGDGDKQLCNFFTDTFTNCTVCPGKNYAYDFFPCCSCKVFTNPNGGEIDPNLIPCCVESSNCAAYYDDK